MTRLTTPLAAADVVRLSAGERVLLSGRVFAARDEAHARLAALLDAGKPLPLPLEGEVIFYLGPTPARPGRVIGAVGPTTSSRMDVYVPRLLALGLRAMIGKGSRSPAVIEAIKRHQAVYFAAVGGVAALLSRSVRESRVAAWEDLGPEALLVLVVEDLPLIVVNDCRGGDLYRQGREAYHG
jgi:fumarate hydratase subunit beta